MAGYQTTAKSWTSQYVEETELSYPGATSNRKYTSGYRMRYAGDSSGSLQTSGNIFVASSTTIPIIQGRTSDWKSKNFNINADELIVNTADGTHTLLKVRMIDDNGVSLPTLTKNGYTSLGNYCQGEGSHDKALLKSNPKNPEALAEVCIAKFNNLQHLAFDDVNLLPQDHDSDPFIKKIWNLFNKAWESASYAVHKPVPESYTDWDIYIKKLNVGIYGHQSFGSDPAFIQTVKASLNYLDTWKEGMGLLSSAMESFKNNFFCYFSFLGLDGCETMATPPKTLRELIKLKIEELKNKWAERKSAFCNAIDVLNVLDCPPPPAPEPEVTPETSTDTTTDTTGTDSDIRLKIISSKSMAGLKEINALKIKNYTFKTDKKKTPHVGVIAQELQKVFPNSVVEGADGYLRIKKEEMFYAMVNAIKELDKQDIQIKKRLPVLNKKIKSTIDKNKKLLTKNEELKLKNEKLMAELNKLEAQEQK